MKNIAAAKCLQSKLFWSSILNSQVMHKSPYYTIFFIIFFASISNIWTWASANNPYTAIVPPDCGPPYVGTNYLSWRSFIYTATIDLIADGAQKFPAHPYSASKSTHANAPGRPLMFWGVIKCYYTFATMQTINQCAACLRSIRDSLLFFSCGDPQEHYTAQAGAFQSALCYFKYTTLEIFPLDSCPYVPDPYEQN